MGLDMYAFAFPTVDGQTFDDPKLKCDAPGVEEFMYWRKHPNLHGFMRALYEQKGGTSEQFNCDWVELDLMDLAELEEAVTTDSLPETDGFFFGQSTPEDKAADLKFIAAAREKLKTGKKVYYTSWW